TKLGFCYPLNNSKNWIKRCFGRENGLKCQIGDRLKEMEAENRRKGRALF
ncbi:hypothetical protein A2U01_0082433, partial [Trifolium medium]|nr:hypothetical protein [Trifolium medium]